MEGIEKQQRQKQQQHGIDPLVLIQEEEEIGNQPAPEVHTPETTKIVRSSFSGGGNPLFGY